MTAFFVCFFGRITKIWELILRYSDYKRFLLFFPEDIDTPEEMLAIVRKLEARDDIYSASISFAIPLD